MGPARNRVCQSFDAKCSSTSRQNLSNPERNVSALSKRGTVAVQRRERSDSRSDHILEKINFENIKIIEFL